MDVGRTEISRRLLLGGGAGGLLALAGCTSAVNSGAGVISGTAKSGGTLTMGNIADAQPKALFALRAGNILWRRLVFDTLTSYDDKGTPQPLLATRWKLDEAKTTMVVSLLDGVKFHTGRVMTAEDAVFSLKQMAEPANTSQLISVAKQLTEVSASGPLEVTIKMAKPLGNALFDLFELASIVDKETFSGIADGSKVIGTGPFMWQKWTPGASLSLKKNPTFRTPGRPYLDAVEIPLITDPTAMRSALLSGRAQLVAGLTSTDVTPLRTDKRYVVTDVAGGGTIYPLGLNVTAAPFDNQQVRQAVAYGIDRDRINKQVFAGSATVTDLWWSPADAELVKDLSSKYAYNPEKAKSLIQAAGAAGATFPVVVANIPTSQSIFEIVQNSLTAIGLKPTARVLETTQYDAAQVSGELGPAFQLLHGQLGFSAATMLNSLPSLNPKNPSHFSSPQYDTLRDAVLGSSEADQKQTLHDLTAFLLDEAFSNVVVQATSPLVATASLTGLKTTALGAVVMTDASLSS